MKRCKCKWKVLMKMVNVNMKIDENTYENNKYLKCLNEIGVVFQVDIKSRIKIKDEY